MDRKTSRDNMQQDIRQEDVMDVNPSHDPEADKKPEDDARHADPFGDEEFAEVKYRTMTWW